MTLDDQAALVYQLLLDRTLDRRDAQLSRANLAVLAGTGRGRRGRDKISEVIAHIRVRGGTGTVAILSTVRRSGAGYWASTDPLEMIEYLERRKLEELTRNLGDLNGVVRPLAEALRERGMSVEADALLHTWQELGWQLNSAQRRIDAIHLTPL